MRYRFVALTGAVVMAVALMPAAPLAEQTPGGGQAQTSAAPRTPWGDPDLRGIYNYATATPLQRPDAVSGKAVLTPEEAEDLQEQAEFRLDRDRRDGGNQADVSRSYNEAWMDSERMKFTADRRSSLVVDPPDGRLPPRVPPTPEVKAMRDAAAVAARRFNAGFMEHYTDGDVGNRCIIRRRNEGGGHPYLPAIYSNVAQIFQAPGYVVLYSEMIHTARVVPLDGRPALPSHVGQWLGVPRGRWEGDTLVVETTNFRSASGPGCATRCNVVYGDGNPQTFKITERFTRTGPNTLEYRFTIEDPTTWTRPFTVSIPWNQVDEQIYEYACYETNYDMYHWLSQARNREAAGEKFDPNAADAGGGDER
jgi:hypothetical protein